MFSPPCNIRGPSRVYALTQRSNSNSPQASVSVRWGRECEKERRQNHLQPEKHSVPQMHHLGSWPVLKMIEENEVWKKNWPFFSQIREISPNSFSCTKCHTCYFNRNAKSDEAQIINRFSAINMHNHVRCIKSLYMFILTKKNFA